MEVVGNMQKRCIYAFEFDDNHTHVIPNNNRIWLNCKAYNREFLTKHNLRFNERQSRHAEDYYFMSCFFHALDNDTSMLRPYRLLTSLMASSLVCNISSTSGIRISSFIPLSKELIASRFIL